MGDTMKSNLGKTALAAALGVSLLGAQGCSMKWLQSDGGSAEGGGGSGWNGQGVNPNFPGTSQGGLRGDLSGFSQNPTDEYRDVSFDDYLLVTTVVDDPVVV